MELKNHSSYLSAVVCDDPAIDDDPGKILDKGNLIIEMELN